MTPEQFWENTDSNIVFVIYVSNGPDYDDGHVAFVTPNMELAQGYLATLFDGQNLQPVDKWWLELPCIKYSYSPFAVVEWTKSNPYHDMDNKLYCELQEVSLFGVRIEKVELNKNNSGFVWSFNGH